MLFTLGGAIDDIISLVQSIKELSDLFWRVLQIIVHCDNNVIVCRANATEQGVMLPVVAHKIDATHPWILACQVAHNIPATVTTTIINKDDFESVDERRE